MTGLSPDFQLRDVYNPRVVTKLAHDITRHYPNFDSNSFIADFTTHYENLSYGDRGKLICSNLETYLPNDFPTAVTILIKSLDHIEPTPGETNWDAFIVVPQCSYVSRNGLSHFDLSMKALYEMTKRFSAENDLRTFIELDYERAMTLLHKWTQDPNVHVRRLVSEGTRPRLPLAARIPRFQKDPTPVIKLLEKLKDDPEDYVRRSVANNLNDISKDHPDLFIETAILWQKGASKDRKWVIKHAARTLLKQGHSEALKLFGFTTPHNLDIQLQIQTPTVQIGTKLEFELILKSTHSSPQALLIDYVVHYVKANGQTKDKVFKWTKRTIQPEDTIQLSRKQFIAQASTRTVYPGTHFLEIQINGHRHGRTSFEVV